MASGMKKRKDLTYEEKLKVIEDYKKLKSVRKVASNFGIGHATVARIYEHRESIQKSFEANKKLSLCHVKSHLSEHGSKIDELTWNWFVAARSKLIPISGPLIQSQALFFAKELNVMEFKASNGWLESFKHRHHISWNTISSGSISVDKDIVNDFKLKLPHLTAGFAPENIFNADQTGLLYRALPTRSLIPKDDECQGGKRFKERLAVLFCLSQKGEKIKPFVIGKLENPQCFKSIKKSELPVVWKANSNASMTAALFKEFLLGLNDKMRKENRNILLFIDNATLHPDTFEYSNVTIKYFPPNTSSHLQPLDQGIIRAFKAGYQKRVFDQLLDDVNSVNSAIDFADKINCLDAIHWIDDSWKELSAQGIRNCFKKAGFNQTSEIEEISEREDGFTVIFSNLQHSIRKAFNTDVIDPMTYVVIDDDDNDLVTNPTHSQPAQIAQEILHMYRNSKDDSEIDFEENGGDNDLETTKDSAIISEKEILHYLQNMKKYCLEKAPHLYENVFALEVAFNSHFLEDRL